MTATTGWTQNLYQDFKLNTVLSADSSLMRRCSCRSCDCQTWKAKRCVTCTASSACICNIPRRCPHSTSYFCLSHVLSFSCGAWESEACRHQCISACSYVMLTQGICLVIGLTFAVCSVRLPCSNETKKKSFKYCSALLPDACIGERHRHRSLCVQPCICRAATRAIPGWIQQQEP